MINKNRISVTVITGFLGAGKTTFINFLLKKYPEIQFALVENEFGEVSIDTKLIKGVDATRMFELKEGCICCTITDEYELILQEMAERFPNVEHLIIETTGIADPTGVIRPFFRDENLHQTYHVNGTVCIVDALNFKKQLGKEILLKQIAIADLVLINKTENISEIGLDELKTEVSNINSVCDIQISNYGVLNSFNPGKVFYKNKLFPVQKNTSSHLGISTKTFSFSTPLNKDKFTDWFSYNLDIYKNEVYRVKGFICFENESYEYVLQGVGGDYELTESENIAMSAKSQIVFIGILDQVNFAYKGDL